MKFGPFEFYFNRSGAVIPAYVDFAGQDGGARAVGTTIDTAPIRSAIGDLKDEVAAVVENQNGLDQTMRKVGAATDRNAAGVRAAEELLRAIQPDVAKSAQEFEALRALLDERTNQILSCLEDTSLALQSPHIQTHVSTDPALTAQYMDDIGAKEEERSPGGRRIWSIGRVRVYECRVGGGEQEVRGAMKEIVALRTQRPKSDSSVDLLAVAISDLALPFALDKDFINQTVIDTISFVAPEYLPTFVRICLKKQQKQAAQQDADSASPQTTTSGSPSLDNIKTIRSKIGRAHGQLQNGNNKNALSLLAEALKLFGGEDANTQPSPSNDEARTDKKSPQASDTQAQRDASPTQTAAAQDSQSNNQSNNKAKGQNNGNREKRKEKNSAKEASGTSASNGGGSTLQLPLAENITSPTSPPTPQTTGEDMPPLLAITTRQAESIEGENRA